MFIRHVNIGLFILVLGGNVSAQNWTSCASEVCSNMGISASTPYDCWDQLSKKYTKKSGGDGIVTPMCNVAEALAKDKYQSFTTVGNCSAAIAESMGIYLSSGAGIGESMCKIAEKVRSTKSLK
jgi:hypothetical protein